MPTERAGAGWRLASGGMEHTPRTDDPFAELDVFLHESDREAPILPDAHEEPPEEEINERILAGLVSP